MKWWKIKDQLKSEINIGNGKYLDINKRCNIYRFEIFNVDKEDSVMY